MDATEHELRQLIEDLREQVRCLEDRIETLERENTKFTERVRRILQYGVDRLGE